MTTIFSDRDATLKPLTDLCIGVIGYGNQGRAHALNLRDSGLTVWVGTREGSEARLKAEREGFPVHPLEAVATKCEILSMMLPDEVIPEVYSRSIEPYLDKHATFIFAHGFAVHHRTISLPDDADILLVAPTGPGRQLRSLYVEGTGLPALVAVEQDVSGMGWQRCLAYAKGLGCTRVGAIKTTFREETIVDLYCEQSVLCGGIPELIKTSFNVLVDRGYQPELAYISCLKEVKLIADLLFESGIDGMRESISNTAKFGSATAGPAIVNSATERVLGKILSRIESSEFAGEFIDEASQCLPSVRSLITTERNSRLARTGRALRELLRF